MINAKPGTARPATRRPAQQGTAEAVKTAVAAAQALGHRRRAARSGTTSRGSTSPTPACRESALCVPQRLDPAAARARLRLGRLLQRRLGHQDRSTTRACSGPGVFALPDQIWIARWDGQANTSTSYIRERRLDAGRPDEAVPGRPRRDVGRGDDQHRPQLPRPRLRGSVAAPRDATATAPASTWPTTRGSSPRPRPHAEPGAGHRAASACSRSRASYARPRSTVPGRKRLTSR